MIHTVQQVVHIVISASAVCENGDLRLLNGSNQKEGRLEICIGNKYGSICDDRWDVLDVTVVCRKLGYHEKG